MSLSLLIKPLFHSLSPAQAGGSEGLDPDLVDETLTRILEDDAYREVLESGLGAGAKVIGIIERIKEFIEDLFQTDGQKSLAYSLLLSLLSLAILAFLVWAIIALRREARSRVRDELDSSLTPTAHLEALLQKSLNAAIAESSWTEALSLRFRIGLLAMVRLHPARLRPGFTNRECLAAWHGQPDYQKRLSAVIELLDRKWYAREECSLEEYERADHVLGEMRTYA